MESLQMAEFTKEMLRFIERSELERMIMALQQELVYLRKAMALVDRAEHD